jgi:hypothetical protein
VPTARCCPRRATATLALLEPDLVAALGYDQPPAGCVPWSPAADALLARLLATSCRRTRPHRLTEVERPTYPFGYRIADLGTFPDPEEAARSPDVRHGSSPDAEVPANIGPPDS